MQAKIQKWGNSLGIRIPSHMAKDLSLKNGSSVEILEEDERLVISPITPRKTLDEVLVLINNQNQHSESFQIQTGKELL